MLKCGLGRIAGPGDVFGRTAPSPEPLVSGKMELGRSR
jgi:hypothetical protein